jgi:hypothetical protein
MSNQEQPKNQNPRLNIVIDKSDIEKDQAAKIENLIRENQAKDDIIKNMLVDHKEKFELENTNSQGLKFPPVGGDSAPLESPKRDVIHLTCSDIDPAWVRENSPQAVIARVEELSRMADNKNKNEFAQILSKIAKKSIQGDKALDITFVGKNCDFMRSPLPLNDAMSIEQQNHAKQRNEKLGNNRINWKIN